MNLESSLSALKSPQSKSDQVIDCGVHDDEHGIYILCHGLRSHPLSQEASQAATQAIYDSVTQDIEDFRQFTHQPDRSTYLENCWAALKKALASGSSSLDELKQQPKGQGVAVSAEILVVTGSFGLYAHLGNTRTYLHRDGVWYGMSRDHTVASEILETASAVHSPFQKTLTRALGIQSIPEPDLLQVELMPGDAYVMTTPGLHRALDPQNKSKERFGDEGSTPEAIQRLIEKAIQIGGQDLASALRVKIVSLDQNQDSEQLSMARLKVETAKALPLFRYLHYRELMKVLELAHARTARPGEQLLHDGQESPVMFVVLKGKVEVFKDGKSVVERPAGSVLGELGIIDRKPASADVFAREGTELLEIPREALYGLFRKHHQIAVKILWALAQGMSQRLKEQTEQLIDAT